MSDNKIRVGITQGDINGIGYEVILKALEDPRMVELCTPIIYGSSKIASFYRKSMDLPPVQLVQIASADDAREDACNIINVTAEDVKVEPGVESPAAGQAAFAALEQAVADLRNGDIDVIVTAPINKHSIQSSEFRFPGHTEYLEASLGSDSEDDTPAKALMILCNDIMRVALVTIHTPISKVAEGVTKDNILERLKIFNHSLEHDFNRPHPRIAVLALNPHAGEDGLLGTEEQSAIIPAIEEGRQARINCFGPYAADGFFGSGAFRKFDGVLAMYHDQGLAAFKALDMDGGVNFTAGLPYVRTSPDHGTGYDIAAKGEAAPESMRNAIYAAIDIFRNRSLNRDIHSNPLRKHYVERNKKDNVKLDLTSTDD